MLRAEIVREADLKAGDSTPGILRKKAFETENLLIGQSHISGGVVSGWHHHGTRQLYGFIVSGRLRIEYGRKGKEADEVGAGDFFHVPAGLVHRDVNPDPSVEVVVVNILIGGGPAVVNLKGPQDFRPES